MPYLTIAIPTYNRKASLLRTLDGLVTQIFTDGDQCSVEIVVSDNCSQDGTDVCVSQWIRAHPNVTLRYFRNESNIGFDANCNAVIERSLGRFVWLLSDDDFVSSDAVGKICQSLVEHPHVAFAFVNYQISVGRDVENSRCIARGTTEVPGEEIFVLTNFAFSFLSSCVINKESWSRFEFRQYIGTAWYHLFVVRDIVRGARALVIGCRLITMRGLDLVASRAEKRLSDNGECEFYIGAYLRLVQYALDLKTAGYADRTQRHAVDLVWASSLRQIFYYKTAIAKYNWDEIKYIARKMTGYFSDRPSFWLMHLPLLFLPPLVGRSLYKVISPVYKRVKRLRIGAV